MLLLPKRPNGFNSINCALKFHIGGLVLLTNALGETII
jgi:hypothetical protein